MSLSYKNGKEVSDSISLLISILVRYPEVATINFHPEKKVLKFTFIITDMLNQLAVQEFKKDLINSIEVFNMLENKIPSIIDIKINITEDFALLEVTRDVETLTKDELSLYIAILQSKFTKNLVTDDNEHVLEEDLLFQEELIGHMLENLKVTNQDKCLIAFREEGKVLVFNK
jgi:mevalonate kinase